MREMAMRLALVLAVALGPSGGQGQPPSGKTGLVYPLVPGHGGVVPLPRAVEQPRKGAKAVFDITADAKPGEVNKGLEHVARLQRNRHGCGASIARVFLIRSGNQWDPAILAPVREPIVIFCQLY